MDGVLTSLGTNDDYCESALQQSANGAYRCAELLAIIAYALDYTGEDAPAIEGILESLESNDERCESAQQQIVNGTYRCVELLAVIARRVEGSARI